MGRTRSPALMKIQGIPVRSIDALVRTAGEGAPDGVIAGSLMLMAFPVLDKLRIRSRRIIRKFR